MLGDADRFCLSSGQVIAITGDSEEIAVRFPPAATEITSALFSPIARPGYAAVPSGARAMIARGVETGRTSRIDFTTVDCADPWPRIHWDAAIHDDPKNYLAGDYNWTLIQQGERVSFVKKSIAELSDGTARIALDWIAHVGGFAFTLSLSAWVELASHRVLAEPGADPDETRDMQALFETLAFDRVHLDRSLIDDPSMVIEEAKPIHVSLTQTDVAAEYAITGRAFIYDYLDPRDGTPWRLRVVAETDQRLAFSARLAYSNMRIDRCERTCSARSPFIDDTNDAAGGDIVEAVLDFSTRDRGR